MKEKVRRFLEGPRLDGLSKVTGRERYAADEYAGEFLWAGVKRALVPHARLLAVHTTRAAAHPGVLRVLTFRDVGGSNRLGIVRNHQPVLVDEVIRHAGDAVALVVAESREALREALDLITFDHEPLPGVFDPEDALEEGAPRIHEDNEEGNLMRAVRVKRGDPDVAFRGCDVVVEGMLETPRQEHAYLETEAGWAYVDDDGVLVVVTSTQT
ncbi:MAG TPA: molybdopterin-dependent oxidoreductase, partial [Syntrophorhabdaceae bacterium]|nr:molybdopterin-dependent oxidoreductase [Syntrophorhabdaceae bacterium]